ncbi:hypothetical protein TKK_0008225 [Trichogramma kaykai]
MYKFNQLLVKKIGKIYEFSREWTSFKESVPTCGAVIFNHDRSKILMVESYRSRIWHFPKGKINEGEKPHECAIREVLEEIGIDIKVYLKRSVFIDSFKDKKYTRLYIIEGVNESNLEIEIKTCEEIRTVQWVPVDRINWNNKVIAHLKR